MVDKYFIKDGASVPSTDNYNSLPQVQMGESGRYASQAYREAASTPVVDMSAVAEKVHHPAHYGGANDAYEAIKVIFAWRASFCVGSCLKYLCRAGRKPNESALDDLKKARFYLDLEIQRIEQLHENIPNE